MKTSSLFKRLVSMLIVVLMICTLFPVTALAATTYTLSYDANGGINPPNEQTQTLYLFQLAIFIIPDTKPTRDGYTFIGWAETADATEANVGSSYTLYSSNPSKTLYAVWEKTPVTYTLTYDANGGTGAPSDQRYNSADDSFTFTIPAKVPTRGGYTFEGWAETADATEANVVSSYTLYSSNPSKTLYAVWEKTPVYTLTYDANGGNEDSVPDAQSYDSANGSFAFMISATVPTRSGYTFLGWADNSNAQTAQYTYGDEITVQGNKTLYAVWEKTPVTYTLTYDANGGIVDPLDQSDNSTDDSFTFTIPATVPTRSGYTFIGWADTANATEANVVSSYTLYSSNPSKTLYAVWKKNAPSYDELKDLLNVIIDCTNGEVSHEDKTYALIPNSEGVTSYSIGEVSGNATDGYTCDITVYAAPYVSAYNTDTGVTHTLDPDTQASATITLVYSDNGWMVPVVALAEGAVEDAATGLVTFTVKCVTPATTYTVTYKDGVGGKVFKDDVHTVESGTTTPAFVGGIPTRPGYVFAGWTLAVSETVNGDATYTAAWRKVNDTVVIEIGGGNSSSGGEENPNTGAPVFVGVSVGALAAAK